MEIGSVFEYDFSKVDQIYCFTDPETFFPLSRRNSFQKTEWTAVTKSVGIKWRRSSNSQFFLYFCLFNRNLLTWGFIVTRQVLII